MHFSFQPTKPLMPNLTLIVSSSRRVWPSAALISDHSTGGEIVGNRPSRSELIVPSVDSWPIQNVSSGAPTSGERKV